jgi:hypothetical protein
MSTDVYKRCSSVDFKDNEETLSDLVIYISNFESLNYGAGWEQRKKSLYELLTHPATFVNETRITPGKEVWLTLNRTTTLDIVKS